jgi:hypothetical protein
MAYRTTTKDVDKAVELLANALGKPSNNCWERVDGQNRAKLGCLRADCNAIYGGCILTEIVGEGGCENHPLGEGRMKPADFKRMINGVNDALYRWCERIKQD